MAKKSWTRTSFAHPGSLELEIDVDNVLMKFPVVQWSATFGINEIPHASCLLGVGRDMRNVKLAAATNLYLSRVKAMSIARVWANPSGERDTDGNPWPAERQLIFVGYYLGPAVRKINGRLQVVVQLVHWLIDLTFSSTLGANHHPSSANDLLFPATIPPSAALGAGGPGLPQYLPQFTDRKGTAISAAVRLDVWSAMKDFLCNIAETEDLLKFPRDAACTDLAAGRNNQALAALRKFEGGSASSPCHTPYRYGRATPIASSLDSVGVSIADFLAHARLETFANQTFWDVLVGQYCANFMLAVVPLIDRALVVAHTPTLRTHLFTIPPEQQGGVDTLGYLNRPLRAVAIIGGVEWPAGSNLTAGGDKKPAKAGTAGCFQPTDSVESGAVLFRYAPAWLRNVFTEGDYAGSSTGARDNVAIKTATTPAGEGGVPRQSLPGARPLEARDLYRRFAQAVYHEEMLRGRSGVVMTPLRFDIAPGSIVKLVKQPEQFLGAEDELAVDHYGHVARVVLSISSEASEPPSTTLQFTHLRSGAENDSDRFTLTTHPLFGDAAFPGAQLVPELSGPVPPSA